MAKKLLNLYLIALDDYSYDEYDSFVIAAKDEPEARKIAIEKSADGAYVETWTKVWNKAKIELIGKAIRGTEKGIILESFNAG